MDAQRALRRYLANQTVARWLFSTEPVTAVTPHHLNSCFVYAVGYGCFQPKSPRTMNIEDMLIATGVSDTFILGVVWGLSQPHVFARTPLMLDKEPIARRFAIDLSSRDALEFMEFVSFADGKVIVVFRRFLHTRDTSLPVIAVATLHNASSIAYTLGPVVMKATLFEAASCPSCGLVGKACLCNFNTYAPNAAISRRVYDWQHFTSLFMNKTQIGTVRLNMSAALPNGSHMCILEQELDIVNVLQKGRTRYLDLLRRKAVHGLGVDVTMPRVDSAMLAIADENDFLTLHQNFVAQKNEQQLDEGAEGAQLPTHSLPGTIAAAMAANPQVQPLPLPPPTAVPLSLLQPSQPQHPPRVQPLVPLPLSFAGFNPSPPAVVSQPVTSSTFTTLPVDKKTMQSDPTSTESVRSVEDILNIFPGMFQSSEAHADPNETAKQSTPADDVGETTQVMRDLQPLQLPGGITPLPLQPSQPRAAAETRAPPLAVSLQPEALNTITVMTPPAIITPRTAAQHRGLVDELEKILSQSSDELDGGDANSPQLSGGAMAPFVGGTTAHNSDAGERRASVDLQLEAMKDTTQSTSSVSSADSTSNPKIDVPLSQLTSEYRQQGGNPAKRSRASGKRSKTCVAPVAMGAVAVAVAAGEPTLAEREGSECSAERKHGCTMCSSRFKMRGDLQRHIKIVHEGKKMYSCETCGKAFGHSGHLNRHISSVHLQQRRFRCQFCGFQFFQASHLQSHISHIHSTSKKFECKGCGLRVNSQSALRAHRAATKCGSGGGRSCATLPRGTAGGGGKKGGFEPWKETDGGGRNGIVDAYPTVMSNVEANMMPNVGPAAPLPTGLQTDHSFAAVPFLDLQFAGTRQLNAS